MRGERGREGGEREGREKREGRKEGREGKEGGRDEEVKKGEELKIKTTYTDVDKVLTSWAESQLPADNSCIEIAPEVVTNSAPYSIDTQFHPPLEPSVPVSQTNVSIGTVARLTYELFKSKT